MIVATEQIHHDQAFYDGLVGKSQDWKYRAVAGLTTREVLGGDPRQRAWAREHGLSRAMTDEQREAWLYGFEWPEQALLRARVVLCDLLLGRTVRLHAAETFHVALSSECYGAPEQVVTHELERAAHQEWVAVRIELGQIVFGGGRFNRCGKAEDHE